MVYKTVSSKNIIARVFRDTKPGTADWVVDALEWLGEVVERIGSYATLEHKVVNVESINNKIPYPCDLECLNRIEYHGGRLDFAGGNLNICDDNVTVYRYQGNYYITSSGCIQTSDERMKVSLYYTAFPVDEDGFPMIPDNTFYKTACFWYICARLAMRGQIAMKYDYCEERYNTYAQLAENDCAFPTPERMQTFKERWCRLVPNVAANYSRVGSIKSWMEIAH